MFSGNTISNAIERRRRFNPTTRDNRREHISLAGRNQSCRTPAASQKGTVVVEQQQPSSIRLGKKFRPKALKENNVQRAHNYISSQPTIKIPIGDTIRNYINFFTSLPPRQSTQVVPPVRTHFRSVPEEMITSDDEEISLSAMNVVDEEVYEPIRTSSGLILTHNTRDNHHPTSSFTAETTRDMSSSIQRQKRFLTYIRYYAATIALMVIGAVATCTVIRFQRSSQVTPDTEARLVPMENILKVEKPIPLHEIERKEKHEQSRVLNALRDKFDEWIAHHSREYESKAEKERRFHIWKDNHFRTMKKNERHGPCKLTNQPVFGSNHFKDLTTEEFKTKYLTGYNGPKADEKTNNRALRTDNQNEKYKIEKDHVASERKLANIISSTGMHDPKTVKRHPDVQERYLKQMEETPEMDKTYIDSWKNCYSKTYHNSGSSSSNRHCRKYQQNMDNVRTSDKRRYSRSCKYWDVSCWLQEVFSPFSSSAEPKYDSYSYPSAVDWRQLGVVTNVHSQGSCGACWAITAVETIESVAAIASGTLRDLSETEVITCDDTCEMCNGGWPQNAYAYVIENEGLPSESASSYDGDFLMALTMVSSGESDELTEEELESYMDSSCPSRGGGSSSTRYGKIKGYAYATERCVCYTDGSGCNCEDQDEELAVRNVASYGPATVCLDASTWQDYSGGILTAESGCSSEFLEMNHCVQTVGYAYSDVSYYRGEENGDSKSGSGDYESKLQGYWIIRNQWSSYWGMNGYIYVAMGENTCGVLNDMTQVFMD